MNVVYVVPFSKYNLYNKTSVESCCNTDNATLETVIVRQKI